MVRSPPSHQHRRRAKRETVTVPLSTRLTTVLIEMGADERVPVAHVPHLLVALPTTLRPDIVPTVAAQWWSPSHSPRRTLCPWRSLQDSVMNSLSASSSHLADDRIARWQVPAVLAMII
ncbi:hypothetical protein NITHO_4510003 [Nitrolancea hollandica Lb]|uniref:Uncharacterized protein n=1 Tax=Nitrolancea hollandica Lb TaxID=1129897 RepID=I4EKB4_9BACT|nr:hypothetical protein NITHO_4510003 [Nitrolancea hollandica Lb]